LSPFRATFVAVFGDYSFGYNLSPVWTGYKSSVYVITQIVYWSDVRERTIHRVKLDGSNPVILLDSSRGIGVVDGMT